MTGELLMENAGWKTKTLPAVEIPEYVHDTRRGQYSSELLLNILIERNNRECDRILGITNHDLFIPTMNFVFGQADLENGVAVISIARLKQEYYSLPPDRKILTRRILTEAIHEIGHTWQLQHCTNPDCVMFFSNSLSDTDHKGYAFCDNCLENLKRNSGV
jgi:archaemetzincin